MRFLDKIALNRLIAIITSFILSIIKMFSPNTDVVAPPKKRRPQTLHSCMLPPIRDKSVQPLNTPLN